MVSFSLTDLKSKSSCGLNVFRWNSCLEAFIFDTSSHGTCSCQLALWSAEPMHRLQRRLKFAKISKVQRRHRSLQRWSVWGGRKRESWVVSLNVGRVGMLRWWTRLSIAKLARAPNLPCSCDCLLVTVMAKGLCCVYFSLCWCIHHSPFCWPYQSEFNFQEIYF